jgi:hypothetical protein
VTEDEVVAVTRRHVESLFPKTCPKCQRVFATFADYLRVVTPIGTPISYDAALGDWTPKAPIGTVSMSNCTCGTTLTLTSKGLPVWMIVRLLIWSRRRARRDGITVPELFARLRARIAEEVLGEQAAEAR